MRDRMHAGTNAPSPTGRGP